MLHRLAVIQSFDPRGPKVGGLETFIRDMIAYLPEDFSLLMIGVDGEGDLALGRVSSHALRGRRFEFLPVLHYPHAKAREAATSIKDSINFQFLLGLLWHLPAIRRKLREVPTSIDLERVEFAPFVGALGLPFVQMLHTEGVPKLKMDSLLKKYPLVHTFNERVAMLACEKFLCVNPLIAERIRATYPRHAHKIDTLSTWVDPRTFAPQPFPLDAGFRIAFAGRLDLFKAPSLMFKTLDRLRRKLGPGVEFHYVGTSDPNRFAEFKLIEDITILHGFKDAQGVAGVLAGVHAGILTSEFEGMPFSVLETLAVGRPLCAIHLPQLESVIKDGVSGRIIPRSGDEDDMAERLADAFIAIREMMRSGKISPELVSQQVSAFTPERQLAKAYENHRQIQRQRFAEGPGGSAHSFLRGYSTRRHGLEGRRDR
jgi:glycosyltransferase involved in cell wall biosynthesis